MTTSLANGGAGLGTLGLHEHRLREYAAVAGFRDVQRAFQDPFNNLYELRYAFSYQRWQSRPTLRGAVPICAKVCFDVRRAVGLSAGTQPDPMRIPVATGRGAT